YAARLMRSSSSSSRGRSTRAAPASRALGGRGWRNTGLWPSDRRRRIRRGSSGTFSISIKSSRLRGPSQRGGGAFFPVTVDGTVRAGGRRTVLASGRLPSSPFALIDLWVTPYPAAGVRPSVGHVLLAVRFMWYPRVLLRWAPLALLAAVALYGCGSG